MKYFLIEEDRSIVQRPFLLNWHEKYDVRDVHLESAAKVPERELLFIRSNPETIFTDVISSPFFLISEKVQKVIKLYEPRCRMKELVLLDKEYGKAERYFLPLFEEIDCLEKETISSPNCGEVRKYVLDANKIEDRSIFRLAGVERQHIVGNLDIVESILKRGYTGISLTELEYIPVRF